MYDVTRRRLEGLARPRPPERPGMHSSALHFLMRTVLNLQSHGALNAPSLNGSGRTQVDEVILRALNMSRDLKATDNRCGHRTMYMASLNY